MVTPLQLARCKPKETTEAIDADLKSLVGSELLAILNENSDA